MNAPEDAMTVDSTDTTTMGLEGGEASFPAVEEVRASQSSRNNGRSNHKTAKHKLLYAGIAVVVLVLVVVVPIAIVRAGKNNTSNSSNSNTVSNAGGTNTAAPRQSSFDAVSAYLVNQNTSDSAAFGDTSSPQYQAAYWLAETDGANLPVPTMAYTIDPEAYRFTFRYVMALNYYALGGPGWTFQMNFLSSLDICLWYDSTLLLLGVPQGVFCAADDPLQVPYLLFMDDNNLAGTLPTENGKLLSLIEFYFQINQLKGPIPTELCSIVNLGVLDLRQNFFTGSIPSCIGDLSSSLSALVLSDNMLHGELPTELATLSQLKSLVLDGNHFSGDFKFVVNNLTALDALIMSNNNFTTVIDSSFLATSINLTLADFSQNNITLLDDGIFPTHLFSMPQLQLLDLSHNKLKGTLPDGLLENTVLQFLALDANQLKGNLSPSLANLKNLTSLSINNNGFIGSMDMFGNMTNLVSLFLSENAFGVGTVPTSFARLTMLSELSLRNTKRQGLLPDFIGNFTNLLILDLGTNALSGAIPSSYGELPNLQYLLLNDNTKIKGSLPATFKKLESLSGLFVEGSTLTGSLNFLCGLPNIQRNGAEDILLADCFGATPKINCTCPACQCCPPTLNNSCPQPLLSSLDASWETNFMRQSYDFVNGTKKIQKHSI